MDQKLKQKLKNLAKEFNLDLFILFGSRANNTNREDSDWDFAFIKYGKFKLEDEFDFRIKLMSILSFNMLA